MVSLMAYISIPANFNSAIYGHRNRSVAYYLRSVKKILARLLKVAKSIPVEYAIDFSKHLVISRTSATLHLMLYQVWVPAHYSHGG